MITGRSLHDDERSGFLQRLAAASPLYETALQDTDQVVEVPVPTALRGVRAFHVVAGMLHRPVELRVAEVGPQVILLGSPESLDELARAAALHLGEPAEAAEYLRFWCRMALRRQEQLVESAADFQWVPGAATDPELRARGDRAAHLARHVAVGHGAGGAFPGEATVLDQRTLALRQYRLREDGHVEEVSRVTLEAHVPVPYTMP
jgi:hypothetical protein